MNILSSHGISEEWLRDNLAILHNLNYKDAYLVTTNSNNELYVMSNNYN